jgi:hypothetical protein
MGANPGKIRLSPRGAKEPILTTILHRHPCSAAEQARCFALTITHAFFRPRPGLGRGEDAIFLRQPAKSRLVA